MENPVSKETLSSIKEFLLIFKREDYRFAAFSIIASLIYIWLMEDEFYIVIGLALQYTFSLLAIVMLQNKEYIKDVEYFEHREQKRLGSLRQTFEKVAEEQCKLPFTH